MEEQEELVVDVEVHEFHCVIYELMSTVSSKCVIVRNTKFMFINIKCFCVLAPNVLEQFMALFPNMVLGVNQLK